MTRPTVMQGKPNSRVARAMRSRVSRGGSQSSGHQESLAGLGLALDAAFLNQVKDGGKQAEAEGGIGQQQGDDVGDEPADADAFGGEGVAIRAQRGDEDEKERCRQGKDSKGDGVVKPPDEEEQAGDGEAQQRFDFADADGHPAMGLDEHFDHGDEVEEEGHSAEMDAGLAPAEEAIEHGREDGDSMPLRREWPQLVAREDT